MDGWIEGLQVLVTWMKCHIVSDTAPGLRLTKPRCEKAFSLHDDPSKSRDFIASQFGYPLQKLTNFLPERHPEI
jgi:hypothetical protein